MPLFWPDLIVPVIVPVIVMEGLSLMWNFYLTEPKNGVPIQMLVSMDGKPTLGVGESIKSIRMME